MKESAEEKDLIEYGRPFQRSEAEGTKQCNEADVWEKCTESMIGSYRQELWIGDDLIVNMAEGENFVENFVEQR